MGIAHPDTVGFGGTSETSAPGREIEREVAPRAALPVSRGESPGAQHLIPAVVFPGYPPVADLEGVGEVEAHVGRSPGGEFRLALDQLAESWVQGRISSCLDRLESVLDQMCDLLGLDQEAHAIPGSEPFETPALRSLVLVRALGWQGPSAAPGG
jgi:hypothetical protein